MTQMHNPLNVDKIINAYWLYKMTLLCYSLFIMIVLIILLLLMIEWYSRFRTRDIVDWVILDITNQLRRPKARYPESLGSIHFYLADLWGFLFKTYNAPMKCPTVEWMDAGLQITLFQLCNLLVKFGHWILGFWANMSEI